LTAYLTGTLEDMLDLGKGSEPINHAFNLFCLSTLFFTSSISLFTFFMQSSFAEGCFFVAFRVAFLVVFS